MEDEKELDDFDLILDNGIKSVETNIDIDDDNKKVDVVAEINVDEDGKDDTKKSVKPTSVPRKRKKAAAQDVDDEAEGVVKRTIFLSVRDYDRLRSLSFLTKKSMSKLVREALADYFSKYKKVVRKLDELDLDSFSDSF